GEKNVDGRRVRMRSTVLSRVMEWLNQDQSTEGKDGLYKRPKTHKEKVDISRLTPIVGMPYYADVEGDYIANKLGFKIIPHLTGRHLGNRQFVLVIDKKRRTISANRLMYAAIHHINPFQIPDSLVVVRTAEGKYLLQNKSDLGRENADRAYVTKKENVRQRLESKMHEAEILQRFYQTGDRSELVAYTLGKTNQLASYLRYLYSFGKERSMDTAMEAVDWFCQRIEDRNIAVTAIYGSLKQRARLIAKQHNKMRDIEKYRCFTSGAKPRER
ncbi:MAG: hypothetical protein UHK44_01885, partial [Bacteroidaceae bacterium]|nr:hypothetical protein [Bacteroidaceae bacterium]